MSNARKEKSIDKFICFIEKKGKIHTKTIITGLKKKKRKENKHTDLTKRERERDMKLLDLYCINLN
jgi:hypothetical protein